MNIVKYNGRMKYAWAFLAAAFSCFLALKLASDSTGSSVCYGTTSDGRLENGVQLPAEGVNFKTYSGLMSGLGRTYVHSEVYKIIVMSYKKLETEASGKIYMYAETGWKSGGSFYPHKTHQNGLSVDFMVPVADKEGKSLYLPIGPLNRFGYDIEFDESGAFLHNGVAYTIDFEAMGAHIVSLHKSARKVGATISRIIFDPKLQPQLIATEYGAYMKRNVVFSKRRSWARHDEHYHVDFNLPCKKAG